ncbi:MAG: hypothetical protein ACRCV9_16235 [Burkholderiaceae bacterium]
MTTQAKLFFDDEFEALNLMVSHGGKTFKELAAFLFPHMKPDSAYARLKACLREDGDQRLSFGQIIAAMNFCGSYEPLLHACDETQHARPARVAAKDQEARLVEVIDGAAQELRKATAMLERVRGGK